MTATPSAPALITCIAFSGEMPPIATAGRPHRARSAANRSGPIAVPASAFEVVE